MDNMTLHIQFNSGFYTSLRNKGANKCIRLKGNNYYLFADNNSSLKF